MPANQAQKMGLNKITGLANGTDPNDAINLSQVTGLVPNTITISTTAPLAGGGDLSANRTLSLNDTAVTPGSYTYSSITVDQKGRLTAASSGAAELPSQGGNSGKYLTTNGSAASWAAVAIPWTLVKKTADQIRTSSTTLTDDTELTFSMAANTTYVVRGRYTISMAFAGGFSVACNGPASPTLVRISSNINSSNIDQSYNQIHPTTGITVYLLEFYISIQNGANAGSFVMRIAQASSNATPTIFEKGSYLEWALIA